MFCCHRADSIETTKYASSAGEDTDIHQVAGSSVLPHSEIRGRCVTCTLGSQFAWRGAMSKTKEPAWRGQARKALGAVMEQDMPKAGEHLREMFRLGPDTLVIEASLLWIDTLFSVVTPPRPAHVPDVMPPGIPELEESDIWGLKLIAARANNDKLAAQALFTEAAQDTDGLLDKLVHLLLLVAMKLELSSGWALSRTGN